jgi:arylsulfatase A-like enzyme
MLSCKNDSQPEKEQQVNTVHQDVPNIVLIMTDQHQAKALSITGNLDVNTPNLDKLAKTGTRFENAYVAFPLCSPSRSSIFTGKMPHTLGINSNEDKAIETKYKAESLPEVLKKAGYHCAYGGKWHAPEVELQADSGFEKIAEFGDIHLAEESINYLKTRKDNPQPFFLVASFDNPHNICEWARNQPLPYGNIPRVALEKTPALPPNFKQSATFPEVLQIEQSASPQLYPTKNYTEADWRQYRYAYYSLVEKVDVEIGKIIDAIDDLGLRDNTIIIFTSDHGDGNASHGWNQKTALFQESINVPFIISDKNKIGHTNTTLVSNGLDLYPTILDYANVSVPEHIQGKSIKPILEKPETTLDRDHVVVETKFAGKQAFGSMGRAVVGKKYKYVLYNWGKHREQLFDLEEDPYEMNNLINSKAHREVLNNHRKKLLDWCKEYEDKRFLRAVILPEQSKLSSADLFDKPY